VPSNSSGIRFVFGGATDVRMFLKLRLVLSDYLPTFLVPFSTLITYTHSHVKKACMTTSGRQDCQKQAYIS
jgi:hypothetical protein